MKRRGWFLLVVLALNLLPMMTGCKAEVKTDDDHGVKGEVK